MMSASGVVLGIEMGLGFGALVERLICITTLDRIDHVITRNEL